MGLVQDDGVVLQQFRVCAGFRQEYAVGHEFDEGVPGRLVVKADLAADPRRCAAFFGYPVRHRECGNPARLGAAYHARLPAPGIQTHPGELGGFAGAGVADQHKTSIAGNRRHNLVMMGHYREVRGKSGQSCLHCRWKGTELIYNAIFIQHLRSNSELNRLLNHSVATAVSSQALQWHNLQGSPAPDC